MRADDWLGNAIAFVGLLVLPVVAIVCIVASTYRHSALVSECVADGHKAYVCEAMLKGRR